jgi:septal ring factor EnvC (AmiA/AmiB activator)
VLEINCCCSSRLKINKSNLSKVLSSFCDHIACSEEPSLSKEKEEREREREREGEREGEGEREREREREREVKETWKFFICKICR